MVHIKIIFRFHFVLYLFIIITIIITVVIISVIIVLHYFSVAFSEYSVIEYF